MVQKMSADMVQRYQVVICDESHYLKSASTKRTQVGINTRINVHTQA